ncbi:fatty acid--CoA ligase family protein [Pseudomonas sp. BN417]|uniref:FadD3 family acyl-CoA ligase n=1 Tax=Pseudomonas sp. BN417 TaxID=2567890 RepID=UPI0024582D31|nr:FadD3 family acyl-CoA ligase [Pseudomonas sp. BN417]MDH4558491.1 fatty acid--CoA ligase family protein [Pseudomonas sp. BN417]
MSLPLANPQTIPAALARSVRRHAQQIAIDDGELKLSYAELERLSRNAGRALLALGLEPGERVAIWAPNGHHWLVAALGSLMAGAVLVPLSTRLKGGEAADILRRSGARVLFSVGEFLGSYYPDLLAGQPLDDLEQAIVLESARDGDCTWQGFLDLAEQVPDEMLEQRMASLDGDSLSDLMFTSGTTGYPKGVLCAHGQNLRLFDNWGEIVGLQPGDRYLIVNPFFHSFGFKAGWLAALIRGATILPQRTFDAEAVLRRVEQDRVSFLPGPPALYSAMLDHPRRADFDLSSLRVAVTGAASVPPVLVQRMSEELGFSSVVTAYGLTESCGLATVCRPGDDALTVASTCGRPLDGIEVRCVDAEGNPVPTGEPGEVLIRGYNLMKGYFNDLQASQEAVDAQGWLHTGDVGVLDERGYLRITDRLKDMFIVGGFNCYPAEVERLLMEHPAVAQAAVVGIADERQGEVGKAYVILRPGASLAADELIGWSRTRMANYKVPRSVQLVEVLPLNAAGKVLKGELRSR